MQNCKKYKPNPASHPDHHRQPKGECQNCVYFSRQNCGAHVSFPGGFSA